jgi:hypothetical protein
MGSDWHVLICEVEHRIALMETANAGFYEVTGTEHTVVIVTRPGHSPIATVIEQPGEPVDTAWARLPVHQLVSESVSGVRFSPRVARPAV